MTPTTLADGWALLRAISDPESLKKTLTQIDDAMAKVAAKEKTVQDRETAVSARDAEYAAVTTKLEESRRALARDMASHTQAVAKHNTAKEATEASHAAKSAELKTEADRLAEWEADILSVRATIGQISERLTARELALNAREEALKELEKTAAAMKADYEMKLEALRAFHATVAG